MTSFSDVSLLNTDSRLSMTSRTMTFAKTMTSWWTQFICIFFLNVKSVEWIIFRVNFWLFLISFTTSQWISLDLFSIFSATFRRFMIFFWKNHTFQFGTSDQNLKFKVINCKKMRIFLMESFLDEIDLFSKWKNSRSIRIMKIINISIQPNAIFFQISLRYACFL